MTIPIVEMTRTPYLISTDPQRLDIDAVLPVADPSSYMEVLRSHPYQPHENP